MPKNDEERLVEETKIEFWCKHCDRWFEYSEGEREPNDPPGICEWEDDDYCNKRTKQAITRILQAVVDGDVKLPGEMGRMLIEPGTVVGHIRAKWGARVRTLIALCKEEK